MCVSMFYILFVLVVNPSFAQGERGTEWCLDEDDYLDGGLLRRTNKLADTPIPVFSLGIWELSDRENQDLLREYRVSVTTISITNGMTAVKIITKGHQECGDGQFTFHNQNFFQFKYPTCPSVLDSEGDKTLVLSPTLYWRPPICGCVKFRVIVVDGNSGYYKDEQDVENGPLSKKVCIKKQRNRHIYLKALCRVSLKVSPINVIGNPYFLSRHDLDAMTVDGIQLMEKLRYRWEQNLYCCNKSSDENIEGCMKSIRKTRIDDLCSYNYTDIPFAGYKVSYMSGRQKECCHLQGEQLYECFGENGELTDATMNTYLDYSMEDTDPVNDLAIFGIFQDIDLLGYVTFVEIQNKTTSVDIYDEKIKMTKTPNNSNRRKKKLTKGEIRRIDKQCCTAGEKSVFNITTKETVKAVIECKLGSKEYMLPRKNILNNHAKLKLCDGKYTNCCLKDWCCRRGELSGAQVVFRIPEQPFKHCQEDYERDVKSLDLNTEQEVCKKRFTECCTVKAVSGINAINEERRKELDESFEHYTEDKADDKRK